MAVFALASCKNYEKGEYEVDLTLTGDLSMVASDTVCLVNTLKDYPFADTAVLAGGKATFNGIIKTPQVVYVTIMVGDSVNTNPARLCALFLEEGHTDVTADFVMGSPEITIKGGAVQTTLDSLKAIRKQLLTERGFDYDSIYAKFTTMPAEERLKVQQLYMEVDSVVKDAEKAYIEAHPTSLYALNNLWKNYETEMEFEEALAKMEAFRNDPAYSDNDLVKEIAASMEALKALQVGATAPDFVQNDMEGNPVRFSDIYKENKVTMIDFWASWCGLCRAFNPELVKIYKNYHRKGFEILGVSLDRDAQAWKKGVENDKLTWKHVSDLGFWQNEAAMLYRIKYIPQNVFVDREGRIIARQLSSTEDIVRLLEENL